MDELSTKRTTSVVGLTRRRSNFSLRQPKNDGGGTAGCNRLGCSTRHNYNKATDVRSSDKPKSLKTISIAGSKASNGSINSSSSCNLKKPKKQKNTTSVPVTVSVASSSGHQHFDDSVSRSRFMDVGELKSVDTVTEDRINSKEEENNGNRSINHVPAEDVSENSENSMPCEVNVKSKCCKRTNQQTGSSSTQNISLSSVRRSITSQRSQTTKPSQGRICSTQRNGIRNLTCMSRSDVSSGCSSMNPTPDKRTKRNSPNGGRSTSRGKTKIGSSASGSSDSQGKSVVKGPPTAKRLLPDTSQTRNQPARRDASSSTRTQETNVERHRLLEPRLRCHGLHMQNSICERTTTRPVRLSHRDATSRRPPSFSNGIVHRQRSCHDNRSAQVRPAPASAAIRYDSQRSMDGNSQVLHALDMIAQEDLIFERALESNIFLASVEYDRHRDMRLDIDDLSYEELLALGEQMGTVSTALTEEALSKCLEKSFYEHASNASSDFDDDIKCSICQEEYAEGDEVGRLWCDHLYHVHCIQQWLRLKNWCPICKASALPS